MNAYISDDGTKFMIVPLVEGAEQWSMAYEATDIPPGAYRCFDENQ